mmetsp:Transcript_111771/g.174586  ORF Transcript_111771/g.174586 Transcript_111771/m.174586 type:complete len:273 (+) Transcript_111771:165-983(+)
MHVDNVIRKIRVISLKRAKPTRRKQKKEHLAPIADRPISCTCRLVKETIICVKRGRWHPLRQLHNRPWCLIHECDFIDRGQERKLFAQIVFLHDRPNLLCSECALQFLPTEQLFLNDVPALGSSCAHEGLGTFAIAPTEASCNEVCDATTLQKRCVLDFWVKITDECFHLLQTDANQSCFGIATIVQPIAKSCAKRHYVFQSSAKFHSRNVVHCIHAKRLAIENLDKRILLRYVFQTQRRLAELSRSNFIRNIRTHEHSHFMANKFTQKVRA